MCVLSPNGSVRTGETLMKAPVQPSAAAKIESGDEKSPVKIFAPRSLSSLA